MTLNYDEPTTLEPKPSPVLNSGRFDLISVGLLLFAVLLGAVAVVTANPWLGASSIGWGSLSLLLIVVGLERTPYPLTHPLLLWGLTLLAGAALRPLYLLARPEYLRNIFLAGLDSDTVLTGATLNAVFLLLALVGYIGASKSGGLESVRENRRSARVPGLFTFAVMGVSALVSLMYMQRLGISFADLTTRFAAKRRVEIGGQLSSLGFLTWIAAIPMFAAFVMVFLRANAPRDERSRYPRLLIAGALLIGIAVPLLNGSRDGLLQPLLVVALAASDFGRRLTAKWATVGFLSALMVISVFGALRSSASNEVDLGSVLNVGAVADAVLGTHNWAGAEKSGVIVHRVPEALDYQYGSTYTNGLLNPIPRAVWPGKPAVRIGPLVGEEIFSLNRSSRTGLPPGAPGELFINFGYVGIPIGGFLFGYLLKLLYNGFLRRHPHDSIRVLYAVVLVNLGLKFPGGDFAGVYTEVLMSTLIMLALRMYYQPRTR